MTQISQQNKVVALDYRKYTRGDLSNQNYKTFNFSGNKVTIETFGRDTLANKKSYHAETFDFQYDGNRLLLQDATGKTESYRMSFIGTSNKGLKIEKTEQIFDRHQTPQTRVKQQLLLRDFPIDNSEDEELFPSPGNPPIENL